MDSTVFDISLVRLQVPALVKPGESQGINWPVSAGIRRHKLLPMVEFLWHQALETEKTPQYQLTIIRLMKSCQQPEYPPDRAWI